jgi:hypothetical protein
LIESFEKGEKQKRQKVWLSAVSSVMSFQVSVARAYWSNLFSHGLIQSEAAGETGHSRHFAKSPLAPSSHNNQSSGQMQKVWLQRDLVY